MVSTTEPDDSVLGQLIDRMHDGLDDCTEMHMADHQCQLAVNTFQEFYEAIRDKYGVRIASLMFMRNITPIFAGVFMELVRGHDQEPAPYDEPFNGQMVGKLYAAMMDDIQRIIGEMSQGTIVIQTGPTEVVDIGKERTH